MGGGTCLKYLSPLGKSSASIGLSAVDLWRGMASRKSHVNVSDLWRGLASLKSHVCELKNWMSMHSKAKKKKPRVGVELTAGGDPHKSEKPGWSADDMRQWP